MLEKTLDRKGDIMKKWLMICVLLSVMGTASSANAFGLLHWAIAANRADRIDQRASGWHSSSRKHPKARAYRRGRLVYKSHHELK